jgi:hypothetical protein
LMVMDDGALASCTWEERKGEWRYRRRTKQ